MLAKFTTTPTSKNDRNFELFNAARIYFYRQSDCPVSWLYGRVAHRLLYWLRFCTKVKQMFHMNIATILTAFQVPVNQELVDLAVRWQFGYSHAQNKVLRFWDPYVVFPIGTVFEITSRHSKFNHYKISAAEVIIVVLWGGKRKRHPAELYCPSVLSGLVYHHVAAT